MLLVQGEVNILDELGNDLVNTVVLVGGLFRRAGNDQRGARLIDEDRVHFVHDGELVAALHAVGKVVLHVVAEIVEPEFIVGAVGDVGGVGRAALRVI